MRFLFIILLIGCQSVRISEPIPEPPELDEIIQEVQSSEELKKVDPVIQDKIVRKFRESQEYNELAYQKIQDLEERLNSIEERNKELLEENQKLKEELATWRAIKSIFIFAFIGLAIFFVGSQLWRFRKLFGSPI